MKKYLLALGALMLIGVICPFASAADIDLFFWAFNDNGFISDSYYYDPLPGNINFSSFSDVTGLGTITVELTSGNYFVALFDHEINQYDDTFFNEHGEAVGTLPAGMDWEIDEPELSTGSYLGDIYTNFSNYDLYGLDEQVFYDWFSDSSVDEEDAAMALAFDYSLATDYMAVITLHLSETLPAGVPAPDFYLHQYQLAIAGVQEAGDVYFWGSLEYRPIEDGEIPEPSTIILVLSGLGLAAVAKFRKSA